ncbi:RNA-directed DNA polymerase, eukaryota, reverse transcriptase zinc-binding domain protein [Tanacetum coccineum]
MRISNNQNLSYIQKYDSDYNNFEPKSTSRHDFPRTILLNLIFHDTPVVNDGFTTASKKKKKGKVVEKWQPRVIEGIKLTKPKPSFSFSHNSQPSSSKQPKKTIVNTKNQFDALGDQNDDNGEIGEANGDKNDFYENQEPINEDEESEVEELNIDSIASWNIRGLNRPLKQSEVRQVVNENHLSVCAILESHVEISGLANVCSKVFRSWDWTSNANFCPKGCRIILGWNLDVVSLMVIAQSSQALHVKIIHKANKDHLYCSFIYAGNVPSVRHHLRTELDIHKQVVQSSPWVIMGDFNVALNMEDVSTGSSSMNSAMNDFKECVANIKVLDINCSGLHYTWNQKPKGSNGILKKLDRIMGNLGFVDKFPSAHAVFKPYRVSDHAPAVLKFPTLAANKPKPFNRPENEAPDWYNTSAFFKKGWDIVGMDVCSAIRDFFSNGQIIKEINHTFIALIPKRSLDSAQVIMDSLAEFKRVSGLVPSIPKSTTFFCNVLNHVKLDILNIMPFVEDRTREGISIYNSVADMEANGAWLWPHAWLQKAPILGNIPAPNLDNNRNDLFQWRDVNGQIKVFSVKNAMEQSEPKERWDRMRQWECGDDVDVKHAAMVLFVESQRTFMKHLLFRNVRFRSCLE